jgi:hypothetical protein
MRATIGIVVVFRTLWRWSVGVTAAAWTAAMVVFAGAEFSAFEAGRSSTGEVRRAVFWQPTLVVAHLYEAAARVAWAAVSDPTVGSVCSVAGLGVGVVALRRTSEGPRPVPVPRAAVAAPCPVRVVEASLSSRQLPSRGIAADQDRLRVIPASSAPARQVRRPLPTG